MRGLRLCLTPFAPDQSGAVSVLYEMGGLIVIVDAGGCAGNVCGFDEPRWRTQGSAVFSAGLRDIDAILGRDELLVEKVVRASREMDAAFVALVGTPVPAVLGTDFRALSRQISRRCGIPCLGIPTTGMRLYDKGAERAWLELLRTFVDVSAEKVAGQVAALGATPLDFGNADGKMSQLHLMRLTHFATLPERTQVVAPAGLAAAQWLERTCGVPYEIGDPTAADLLAKVDLSGVRRALVVHQAVRARSLAAAIEEKNPAAEVTCATWFMAPAECGDVRQLREEDDFAELVRTSQPDLIVTDAVLRPLVRDFDGTWIDDVHFAVSGRLA